jgi:hypothetical protein
VQGLQLSEVLGRSIVANGANPGHKLAKARAVSVKEERVSSSKVLKVTDSNETQGCVRLTVAA